MQEQTGYIVPKETADRYEAAKSGFIDMKIQPTKQQMLRNPPRVRRNEPCPCGSGKKFKKCHMLSNYNGGQK